MKMMEALRLVGGQGLRCGLEFISNGFQQRVPVFYDNGCVESVSFNDSAGCADCETTGLRKFVKPAKEQTIALRLSSVAIITNVKQDVQVLSEKLVDDGQNGLFYFWVVRRVLVFNFLNNKLKSFATAQRLVMIKVYSVMDTLRCDKVIAAILSYCYLIWRLFIQRLQGKLNHRVTMVPVNPICLQRSSKRFSAFRLISSERLKRAKASSYVIFFVSIMLVYLTFYAAKIIIKNEKNK